MAPAERPAMLPFLGALLGLVVGSFLATLVLRLPRGEGPGGRSRCDACGIRLGPAELVPLLSYAAARGRCRRCGAAIDWRHPAIEAAAGLVGGLAFLAAPWPAALAGALLGWALVALIALDCEHHWLPDVITLPLLAAGLLLGAAPPLERLLGAALGGGLLLLLRLGYRRLRGREGLGLGDVKLMAALGGWLGAAAIPALLLGASSLGFGLIGLARLRGEPVSAASRIPLGACLGAVAFPLWLFSGNIFAADAVTTADAAGRGGSSDIAIEGVATVP
jgi:leader peptidase (prepilin peptidase)/N-methyltransferase